MHVCRTLCTEAHSAWEEPLQRQCFGAAYRATALATTIAGALLAATSAPGFSEEPLVAMSAKARPSVIYLDVEYPDQKTKTVQHDQGSGVLVSSLGDVLTAYHVVEHWVELNEDDQVGHPIYGSIGTRYASTKIRLRVEGYDSKADIALLHFLDTNMQYSAAQFCYTRFAPTGSSLYAFGFPDQKDFTPIAGTYSNSNDLDSVWEASTPFAHGMSGGPVYDADGFVVGLIRGGLDVPVVDFITPILWAKSMLDGRLLAGMTCSSIGSIPSVPVLTPSNPSNSQSGHSGTSPDRTTTEVGRIVPKCEEIVFSDYSKIPASFEKRVVCQ